MRKLKPLENLTYARLFMNDYLAAHFFAQRASGDRVLVKLPFENRLFFHPDDIEQILRLDSKNFRKNNSYDKVLKPLLGQGLLLTYGKQWKHDRKLFTHEFSLQNTNRFFEVILRKVQELELLWIQSAKSGEARDLSQDMRALTLSFIGEVLLHQDLTDEIHELSVSLERALEFLIRRITRPIRWPSWVPTSNNRQGNLALKTIETVSEAIFHRIRTLDSSDSMLGSYARNPERYGLTRQQVIDQIKTFLFTGHDTTAHALTWAFLSFVQEKECAEHVREEALQLRTARESDFKEYKSLTYCQKFLQEVLRLYPSAPTIGRTALTDTELSNVTIRKGQTLTLSPYVTHRHPEFWPEPERFRPDRFSTPLPHPMQYFPFSHGMRGCIGQFIAMLELGVVFPYLAARFEIESLSKVPIRPKPRVSLQPDGPVPIRIRRLT